MSSFWVDLARSCQQKFFILIFGHNFCRYRFCDKVFRTIASRLAVNVRKLIDNNQIKSIYFRESAEECMNIDEKDKKKKMLTNTRFRMVTAAAYWWFISAIKFGESKIKKRNIQLNLKSRQQPFPNKIKEKKAIDSRTKREVKLWWNLSRFCPSLRESKSVNKMINT